MGRDLVRVAIIYIRGIRTLLGTHWWCLLHFTQESSGTLLQCISSSSCSCSSCTAPNVIQLPFQLSPTCVQSKILKASFELCSIHPASGVLRATKTHERRGGAQAAPQFAIYYCVPVWGRYLNNRSHWPLDFLHEGGRVRAGGTEGQRDSVRPLITCSYLKTGENRGKVGRVDTSRCTWPLSSWKQVRCKAGQSQSSWRVIFTLV